jgi:hypothetical protein
MAATVQRLRIKEESMKGLAISIVGAFAFASPLAYADWHSGKVTALKIGYDGVTVAFNIAGYSRSNCTCYVTWSSDLCLNPLRESFRAEVPMLMSARARDTVVHVNIDEVTCSVIAIYESG